MAATLPSTFLLADILPLGKIGMIERPYVETRKAFSPIRFSRKFTPRHPVRAWHCHQWQARPQLFTGIADAVTVLARIPRPMADAAATIIANAVNLPGSPRDITRIPARELSPDSRFGDLRVTRGVEPLSRSHGNCRVMLSTRGVARGASRLRARG